MVQQDYLGAHGYYYISSVTFCAPATGLATLQLKQDGTQVQGATASTTLTTTTTEIRSISFDAIVRLPCGVSAVTLTMVNNGVAITSSNIAIAVEYLN